ncbi:MAG: carboxymuconolactone decarboxylase family protein [Bacteroidales bacterium]|nr:carboxymuconolactone decarboxylase family protein [Lentimicrobiaceae bacterium]MDD5696064.1 carboxymuconolactone decarboxylase family protein [Bacteroidales bacterium]
MKSKINKPRLVPLDTETMPAGCKEILKRIPGDALKGKFAPVNVLGTLMYNPDTLEPFLDYWVTSKSKMGLTVREQELVILRMAVHYRCNYVWKHHVPVAIEFGVTENLLEGVKDFPLPPIFNAREEALLILTDELVTQRDIRDEVYEKYHRYLRNSELVDLISLVSQYVLFSLANNALRVEVEPAFDGITGL